MKLRSRAGAARTAHDQDHLNQVRIKEFGVVELRLQNTKDKGSKSHLKPGAIARRKPSGKGTDAFHFAPGPQLDPATWKEDPGRRDEVEVVCDIYNPQGVIREGKLQLFTGDQGEAIWSRDLTGEELADGVRKLRIGAKESWDGSIGGSDERFPDGYLTVEHSPYKLRITVSGDGVSTSPEAWTYFYVLIDHLRLEYGPEQVLPEPKPDGRDYRAVLSSVVAQAADPSFSPKQSQPIRIALESNIFATSANSWQDNSAYVEYENRWPRGPQIPLFAATWIKDSAGRPVLAPRAIGKLRFLWDWESKLEPPKEGFVRDAENYDVSTSHPKGWNCHADRGGKRGSNYDLVFPDQSGVYEVDGNSVFDRPAGDSGGKISNGNFPFRVQQCPAPRSWAAFSRAWTKGTLASKTGVIFSPSRMAGDSWRVTVYAAYELDKSGNPVLNSIRDAPLPAASALKASTGIFQIWREIHVARYVRKTSQIRKFSLSRTLRYYHPAFLEIVDKAGEPRAMDAQLWNKRLKDAIPAVEAKHQSLLNNPKIDAGKCMVWQNALLIDPELDQHKAGDAGVYFRTFHDWKQTVLNHNKENGIQGSPRTEQELNRALQPCGVSDQAHYAQLICEPYALELLEEVFRDELDQVRPGLTVFQVEGLHNLVMDQVGKKKDFSDNLGFIGGEAAHFSTGGLHRAGYIHAGLEKAFHGDVTQEIIAAHEIGHHLFLPHTPEVIARHDSKDHEPDYYAHEEGNRNCLMRPAPDLKSTFCGLCLLRLRGWPKGKGLAGMPHGLDTISANNKKP